MPRSRSGLYSAVDSYRLMIGLVVASTNTGHEELGSLHGDGKSREETSITERSSEIYVKPCQNLRVV